jgi:exopolysaccharide production protein ExoQ
MSRGFLWIYRLYAAAAMGALAEIFNEGTSPRPDLFNVGWVDLYLASLPYILADLARGMTGRGWLAYGLAAYVALAPLWSELPLQSLKFATAMALNILFAVSVALRMTLNDVEKQTALVVLALLSVSLVMVGLGVEKSIYRDELERLTILGGQMVQGIFSHKNFLGVYAALGLVLTLAGLRGPLRWGGAALCLWGVLASGAATGLAALVAGVVVFGLVRVGKTQRWRLVLYGPAFAAFAIVATFAFNNQAEILAALGRDDNFTGRTNLWAWAIWFFEQKPLIGWGYGGIFAENAPGPSDIFYDGGYTAPHFHSGYLQVLAETGAIGFAATIVFCLGALTALARRGQAGLFAGLILLLAVMPAINLLLRFNDLATILIVTAFVAGGRNESAETRDA